MAGSRVEKFRTIYSRMQGLIRSGAVKNVDKPIWYDVYEAFPPKPHTPHNKNVIVRNILYREDLIRAEFYNIFGNPDVADLTNEVKTTCQRFVEKYRELEKEGVMDKDQLFDRTADMLRFGGNRLRTLEDAKLQIVADVEEVIDSDVDEAGSSVLSQLMDEMQRDNKETQTDSEISGDSKLT